LGEDWRLMMEAVGRFARKEEGETSGRHDSESRQNWLMGVEGGERGGGASCSSS